MSDHPLLGVIGGSGLYRIEGLADLELIETETPFGAPSAPIMVGTLGGRRVAFLARHGKKHQYSPTEINYRANIYALKALGIKRLLAISACGSLRQDFAPGEVVIPDQIYDNTNSRARSFFEGGMVAHVSVADPFCPHLSTLAVEAVAEAGGVVHEGGTFITIEGPRFSTRAESNTYRSWGISIIGMTTSPEAFLAREAEMCYSVMAHVTDYDVWHRTEDPVSVEMVVRILKSNTELLKRALIVFLDRLPDGSDCICGDALKDALITGRESIPEEARARLKLLVDRYLD